jgi:ParB family chromosome partitioning protein
MKSEFLIRDIPIERIRLLNPRNRSRRSHDEIVESIEAVGLKRPITVSKRVEPDGEAFALICGQGRLEAYQKLGQDHIPAVVLDDLPEEACLVRGLVENVARRRHDGAELMGDILALHLRGYADAEIADKIGLLLERGEAQLVKAVEAGYLPLSLAVAIACESEGEVQRALAQSYASGTLKAADVARVRRLLDRRARSAPAAKPARSAQEIMDTLQDQAERHRLALKSADLLQTRLAFVVAALRDLLRHPEFARILHAERLDDLPKALAARLSGGWG